MASETHYLRSILPSLPTEIASKLRNLCSSPANESVFENLIRFLSGVEHSPDASKDIYEQWSEKQATTRSVLSNLTSLHLDKKRPRDEDQMGEDADSQQSNKRQRVPQPEPAEVDSGDPLITLHALSATSPIRKKVDITIHKNVIKFTNPTTHASEGSISVSSLKRAFIVPTRGKSKPHWTVIILSSDIPDRGKPTPGSSSDNPSHQLIFGTDATCASNFSITTYPDAMSHITKLAKGTSTLPSLREFLSHLDIPVTEPTVDVFKSACPGIGSNAGVGGIPGVEAYRAAKAGNLWFSKDGILWGESKPCEFWPVTDLISKTEGLRVVGSGRTCSVILTRKSGAEDIDNDDDVGEETEFGMVDAKEKGGINEWVRDHCHLFGNQRNKTISKEEPPKVKFSGPFTIHTLTEDSDDEDDDFSASVSDLDGSERLSEESSSEDEDNGNGDEQEHNSDADADADEEDLGDEVSHLDPGKHPLLRPGAMPRMSRAALEMAVGIVENAFVGTADQEDEKDELDD